MKSYQQINKKSKSAASIKSSPNKFMQNKSSNNSKNGNNNNNNNRSNKGSNVRSVNKIDKIFSPTTQSNNFVNYTASMKNSSRSDGSIIVSHREYIGDINTEIVNNSFVISNSIQVNPGLFQSFPWLYRIAQNYESYTFKKLAFEFQTASSTLSQSSILMAFDYDPADPAPSSKIEMMQYHSACRTQVWNSLICAADSKDLKKFAKEKYIRSGPLPAGQTIQNYDVANFYLAYTSSTSSSFAGELYVTYEVELQTPQAQSPASYLYNSTYKSYTVLDLSEYAPLTKPLLQSSTAINNIIEGGLPITLNINGSTMSFPLIGEYLVVLQMFYSDAVSVNDGVFPTISGTTPALDYEFSPFGSTSNVGSTGVVCSVLTVKTTQVNQAMTWNFTPCLVADVSGHLLVVTTADRDVISIA